ncbi:MAG: hypothetical protein LBP35_05400 [Candidatus Ancillula trichonymphae]|nr:hypothetical protein [Candidatus Ancillula trichonymphae]
MPSSILGAWITQQLLREECSEHYLLGGFFMLIAIKSRGALGGGDVKLMFILPLYFGLHTSLIGTFCAFILMLALSTVFVASRKWNRETQLPLVPCMAFGFLLATLLLSTTTTP